MDEKTDKIRIEIHNVNELEKWGLFFATTGFIIWLVVLLTNLSGVGVAVFLVVNGPVIACIALYYSIHTVITADDEKIEYKHLLPPKQIKLSDIQQINCEPYTTRSRYGTYQRIKFSVTVHDGETYEFNDQVNTNTLLTDRLQDKQTDVPIIKLYEFVAEKKGFNTSFM